MIMLTLDQIYSLLLKLADFGIEHHISPDRVVALLDEDNPNDVYILIQK